jgi:hypothetical protein
MYIGIYKHVHVVYIATESYVHKLVWMQGRASERASEQASKGVSERANERVSEWVCERVGQ